ncbi:MAG: SHOCT domain-containing protein [Nitriliruptoraceae bacterium]
MTEKESMMMWGFGTWLWWMSLVWLALLGVAVWLVISINRPTARRPGNQALTILAERFARGEIDHDEFESRRSELARQ